LFIVVDAHETDQYILHQSQLQSVFFRQRLESTVNVIDLLEQKQKRKRSASVSVFSRPSNFLSRG